MRVLVACASRHGGTSEIADRVASVLAEHEHAVERLDVGDRQAVARAVDHDAVVVGSAVYYGDWTPEARRFVEAHRAELTERPVWMFSSGPLGERTTGSGLDRPTELPRLVRARDHHVFAGRLERDDLGRVERAVARLVRAPAGDFRDWREIDSWSNALADELDHVHDDAD